MLLIIAEKMELSCITPHCSHKFQSLDRIVHGLLKKLANTASDAWTKMNPAKPSTRFSIPRAVKTAFPAPMTPKIFNLDFKILAVMGFRGFVRTSSWSVVIISKPVLVFCYRP